MKQLTSEQITKLLDSSKFIEIIEKMSNKEKSLFIQYMYKDFNDILYHYDGGENGDVIYNDIKNFVGNIDDEKYHCPFIKENSFTTIGSDLVWLLLYTIENLNIQ